jgi:hypothetical protein
VAARRFPFVGAAKPGAGMLQTEINRSDASMTQRRGAWIMKLGIFEIPWNARLEWYCMGLSSYVFVVI